MSFQYVRPKLYRKQEDCFFNDKRYSFIEGSTKSGKTVGSMAWLLERTLIHTGKGDHNLWVAPVYAQAKIAFLRYKVGLPKDIYRANESELYLEFKNGARIWFKGGDKPDTIYGQDYKNVVADEASRSKDDLWAAVRSTTTATRGLIRAIGNVRGRHNWHYKLCRKAESGEPDMYYSKLVAADAVAAGVLDAAEIEDAKRVLPDNVFRELYLCEPSDDGGNPFGLTAISNCIAELSLALPVCWGIDLAKSVDWTVAIALDAQGKTCRFERFQKPWPDTMEYLRNLIGSTPALVDSTGVGDPVVEVLQKGGRNNVEGFKFTQPTKQQIMEGLAVAIQQKQISYPDGVIVNELECFEYEYSRTGVKYSAPEGLHDDCVCALALAVRKHTKPITAEGWLEYMSGQAKESKTSFTLDITKQPGISMKSSAPWSYISVKSGNSYHTEDGCTAQVDEDDVESAQAAGWIKI